MVYILKGNPKEVAKVLQENRIRVDRGVIEFTPCQPDPALDSDSIATLREVLDAKTKECVEIAADQLELANLIEAVVDIVVKNGIVIPDDLSARLAKFITVPISAETVSNNPDIVEDYKTVDVVDMTEVKLDDVKDIEEADSKIAQAPAPKKTRIKKSE